MRSAARARPGEPRISEPILQVWIHDADHGYADEVTFAVWESMIATGARFASHCSRAAT